MENTTNIQSPTEILCFINELEKKYKPQSWKYKGVDIWPIIRITLYYEFSYMIVGSNIDSGSFRDKMVRLIKAVTSIFNSFRKPAQVLLISDGISYINLNDTLYEKFCDPIIDILEKDKISWNKWNITDHVRGRFFYPAQSVSAILDWKALLSFIKPVKDVNLPSAINEMCTFINESSGGKLNWSAGKIKKKISVFTGLEKWSLKQLKHIKPSLVIIVCYYADRTMAIIKACNDLNIRSADIQHGVQGKMHAAYSSWNEVPDGKYNTLPDDFLVWSDTECKIIGDWTSGTKHECQKLGNLFAEKWLGSADDQISKIDERIDSTISKMKAKRTALFTMQSAFQYTEDFFELIRSSQHSFNWLIRLHPVLNTPELISSLKQQFQQSGIFNYEIDMSSSIPLYGLLRHIHIHVTHSSSTVLEALDFGVGTLILDKYGSELFSEELKLPTVAYITEIGDRLNFLETRALNRTFFESLSDNPSYSPAESQQLTRQYISSRI